MRQPNPPGAIARTVARQAGTALCYNCGQVAKVPKPIGGEWYCKRCAKMIRLWAQDRQNIQPKVPSLS